MRRVLDAARELGYRPHAAARSLRRAATGALGLLVPALGNPVYTQLMRGAFRRAGELGFTVVLAEDFEEQEAGELFARLVLEGRMTDDARAVELALGHLVELGHRSIVHVAGPLGLDPVERRIAASGRLRQPPGSNERRS